MKQVSPEVLRQLLRYDPETGKLFWRERGAEWFSGKCNGGVEVAARRWNDRYAGTEALNVTSLAGYKKGAIFDTDYRAHRVIWAMMAGEWPRDTVDHINGIRDDNRWANLRAATIGQNSQNRRSSPGSTSKYIGVSRATESRKWRAAIRVNGQYIHLGLYEDEADAAKAYDVAARAYYNAFACPNFKEVA